MNTCNVSRKVEKPTNMNTAKIATVICRFFSVVSGITVMGDPSEIYTYGTLHWLGSFSAPLVGILDNYFYLPVFYELQITSVYEVSLSNTLINTQPIHKC
jgi:hypothetical protein